MKNFAHLIQILVAQVAPLCGVLLVGMFVADFAQAQTIQQPVIGQFGVQTSVMVPDRGGVYLGGVKRAGESSFNSIFSPFGSAVGRFAESTGLSSHVFISDLQEMDALILEAADRPDGIDYLRRIHSGVAFDPNVNFRGGAVSNVSPLAPRFSSLHKEASRIPGVNHSNVRNHYGAALLPFHRDNRPTTPSSNVARQIPASTGLAQTANSNAKQAQSDRFLDDLFQSMNSNKRVTSGTTLQADSLSSRGSSASRPPVEKPASPFRVPVSVSNVPIKQPVAVPRSNKLAASRAYLLGRQAERAGEKNAAILHYRSSMKLGSKPAKKRLQELDDVTVAKQ